MDKKRIGYVALVVASIWMLLLLTAPPMPVNTSHQPVGSNDFIGEGTKYTTKYSEINNLQDNRSLADVLRKYSSLDIRGSGDNVRIYVRGQSTITLETQPLFIVNNTRMGRDYASVNNSINPNEIISVRVLRSLTETAIYGEEGNHGVIIIKTKNTKL